MADARTCGRFQKGHSGNPRGRTPGSKNRPRHLPLTDAITAATLARRGYSATRIARVLRARPEAVRESITQARRLLELFAPEFAINWLEAARVAAKRGNHKPAMAALQSIGVVKPIPQTYDTAQAGNKASAAVHVQFVGLPTRSLPAVDTSSTEP
jgi:hypothetical protein